VNEHYRKLGMKKFLGGGGRVVGEVYTFRVWWIHKHSSHNTGWACSNNRSFVFYGRV